MSSLDSRDKIHAYVQQVASHRGWKVNTDQDFTQGIEDGLASNAGRWGYPACPCRETEGDRHQDKDIVCPCRYAEQDIQEWGQCYCGLFLRKDKKESEVSSIPERRPQS